MALTLLILVILGLYCLLLIFLIRGIRRLQKQCTAQGNSFPRISILIPYKNEKENLPDILSDLVAQDYPRERLHAIFINDHSADGSPALLKTLAEPYEFITCLDLPGEEQGKKAALAMGVQHADSMWILQTDADCRLLPDFLHSRMACIDDASADLVAGAVKTRPGQNTFLERFEELEVLSLTASGAGSYAYRRALMCSGANLLYRRSLYEDTRHFDPLHRLASGDDMFLLIGARKLGKKIAYQASRECTVFTGSASSWGSLFRQRVRWGSKSKAYAMPDIQATALLVVLAALAFIFAPVGILLERDSMPFLLGAMLLKLLLDFVLLLLMSRKTGQQKALVWYLPVSLIHPFFIVFTALLSLLQKPAGKGSW